MSSKKESTDAADRNFVVVASRLPVDRVEGPDGQPEWQPSPGGLVTALEPVMRRAGGAWIGWSGDAGPAPGAFEADGLHLVGLALSETEVIGFLGYSRSQAVLLPAGVVDLIPQGPALDPAQATKSVPSAG